MLEKTRWIPPGRIEKSMPGVDAVAYVTGPGEKPCAIGYTGKASKAAFNYSFRSEQQMNDHVTKWLDKLAADAKAKAAEKAAKSAARAGWVPKLKAGDILYGSWGYDQTNVEFFKVLEVKGKRALVQETLQNMAGGEGNSMSGDATPTDTLHGEPSWRPILMGYQETDYVNHPKGYCRMSLWDGKPKYCSWYA